MITRVEVRPELLTWACERGGSGVEDFGVRFPSLTAWIDGAKRPTLKQLEEFAVATHTPVGYLFLPAPPIEKVPISDLRTMARARPDRPRA
jgi:hypothetical protein